MLSIKEFEHRMKKAALEALEAAAHRVAAPQQWLVNEIHEQ